MGPTMKRFKLALTSALLLAFCVSHAAPKGKSPVTTLPPKKKAKVAAKPKKSQVTALPAYKGKTRVAVSFNAPARPSDTGGVVIRSIPASEYSATAAAAAQAEAEQKRAEQTVQFKAVAAPLPVETVQLKDLEDQILAEEIGDADRLKISDANETSAKITVLAAMPTPVPTPVSTPQPTLQSSPQSTPQSAPQATAQATPVVEPVATPIVNTEVAQVSLDPPVAVALASTPVPQVVSAVEIETPAAPSLATSAVAAPTRESFEPAPLPVNRLSFRTSYLAARYSQIQGDLQDGATSMGLSFSRSWNVLEGKISVDFAHGLDQKVSLGNSRMTILRADVARFFNREGLVSPFLAGGLGFANSTVKSYRQTASGTIVTQEHVKSNAVAIAPGAGVRVVLTPKLSFDLGVEYLALIGGSQASSLGGLSAGGSLGVAF